MYTTPEQIQTANKANVEACSRWRTLSFRPRKAGQHQRGRRQERVRRLDCQYPRPPGREGCAGVRDVAVNSFAQPVMEKAIAYSKSVYEVATGKRTPSSARLPSAVSPSGTRTSSACWTRYRRTPWPASVVAVAAIKSMLAGNSAYDNLTKVAKQATETVEANVTVMTETVKGLAKAKRPAQARNRAQPGPDLAQETGSKEEPAAKGCFFTCGKPAARAGAQLPSPAPPAPARRAPSSTWMRLPSAPMDGKLKTLMPWKPPRPPSSPG